MSVPAKGVVVLLAGGILWLGGCLTVNTPPNQMVSDEGIMSPAGAGRYEFGEPLEGVRIRLRPRGPAFQVGKPLMFFLDIQYDTKDEVGFFLPVADSEDAAPGLGRNVEILIDGKAIEQPDFKPSWLVFQAAQGKLTGLGFRLPAGVRLAEGRHTIRYTVHCPGGEGTSGDVKVRVIKGDLISNTLEFTVAK